MTASSAADTFHAHLERRMRVEDPPGATRGDNFATARWSCVGTAAGSFASRRATWCLRVGYTDGRRRTYQARIWRMRVPLIPSLLFVVFLRVGISPDMAERAG